MADSGDEFDIGLDDEALLLAAADADVEQSRRSPDKGDGRAPKRQRVGEPMRAPLRTISGIGAHRLSFGGQGASAEQPFEISSQHDYERGAWNGEWRLRGPHTNLKQTTLFGVTSVQPRDQSSQQPEQRRHNWPLASKAEPPTHHRLNNEELDTWVYPINIGSIRDYQFNIVARGLYHNLLVALPTGLGKTFIAATIMLNWLRWTTDSQIVFVAPTKPLVSQQVNACFQVAGIPRSATTMLTGGIPPGIRAEEWSSKRVFFMTPQTIINDLKTGICDPKKIVLLVVDEAHRATGAYAYVEVVKFLRRFNTSFRVLALTATPGSTVESVQEVIDGLGISRVEIRTEDSLDIREYVHQRNIETTLFEYSEEIVMCMDLFSKALQPLVNKLKGMNAYWSHNPMTLTAFGCTQSRMKWMNSDAGQKAHWGLKGMVNALFSILASLAHAIDLLKFHGIGPFYHKLVTFRSETLATGEKGSRHKREVIDSEPFQKLMSRVQTWVSDRDFVGHPKLEALRSIALNHFMDAGEGRQESANQVSPARTRVMVFAHFRDSAEEIVRVLKRNEPMLRPHVFVGQANSKGSEGMDQKTQLDIIDKFRKGVYNILVATSIGEEGLDIGEVDLIVCYDGSSSPIRMLQRMGRTGRKRAGRIEVLLMKDKEHNNFLKAKDNYEKMQEMIASGKRFTFHDELSPRILPRDVQPVVEKKVVEIPIENTQADLPEPKKRGKVPKRPPKKFHMPDNALLGFTTASRMVGGGNARQSPLRTKRSPSAEPVPPNSKVFLTDAETLELERTYQSVSGEDTQVVEHPRLNVHPDAQREARPIGWISHSKTTKSLTKMLSTIHKLTDPFTSLERFEKNLDPADKLLVDGGEPKKLQPAFGLVTRLTELESYVSIDASGETASIDLEESAQVGASGETLGPSSESPDKFLYDDDPRNASDLADFINDEELSPDDAETQASASSPILLAPAKIPIHARDLFTSSQASQNEDSADLDMLLDGWSSHPRKRHGQTAISRRRKAIIDSESDDE